VIASRSNANRDVVASRMAEQLKALVEESVGQVFNLPGAKKEAG
jgi:hypothetical protein